ncbi:MAG: polysaccharide biosynthesis protein [Clostridiales bacterium]|nr:polysaccharide biosynthesis protein [Clostridiales bacterium]
MKKLNGFLFEGKFRRFTLFSIDILIFAIINALYYLLSNSMGSIAVVSDKSFYFYNSLLLLGLMAISRMAFQVYNNVWRYTNTRAYLFVVIADAVAGIVAILVSRLVDTFTSGFFIGIWQSLTVASLTAITTLSSRFIYRLLYKHSNLTVDDKQKIRVGIVGAGQLGAYLSTELKNSPSSTYEPLCFIDVDKSKVGKRISNLPIYSADKAEFAVKKHGLSTVIFAIANMPTEKTEQLWKRYSSLGCKIKTYALPLDNDTEGAKPAIRDFSIEDLLFRAPLDINKQAEFDYYKNKTILVTGGGGSIGSELCRQIARCSPKQLIIFDIYENNAYDIQQELIRKYGSSLDLKVEIGSVRDVDRVESLFLNYKPQIVFHAAAHKHVPLMEHSAGESIKNNVMGTFNVANCAEKYGVNKFILISTDKAVNPTNVMGASKRLCEMVVQCRTDSKTDFAAVRFGNVLGSNGSVIPLFRKQIASGGPVTITDKRIIRYFMTIPEASQLVMLAGAKAKKGELFVLDMGQPVRIYDLAVNMIKLMGLKPERDIEIKEIGLRPGEKLYEELLMKNETLVKTDNKMIFIERDRPYSREEISGKLKVLLSAVEQAKLLVDSDIVKEAIKQTVPTFVEPDDINKNAASTEYFKNKNVSKTAE